MHGKPLHQATLSEAEKRRIMEDSQHLKELAAHPGWGVFVEILASAIDAEEKVDGVPTDGLSDAAIGREVKLRKAIVRRLRIVTDNVVSLVQKGDNFRRLEKLRSAPSHILRKSMKK